MGFVDMASQMKLNAGRFLNKSTFPLSHGARSFLCFNLLAFRFLMDLRTIKNFKINNFRPLKIYAYTYLIHRYATRVAYSSSRESTISRTSPKTL
jgi:hypothetical protein